MWAHVLCLLRLALVRGDDLVDPHVDRILVGEVVARDVRLEVHQQHVTILGAFNSVAIPAQAHRTTANGMIRECGIRHQQSAAAQHAHFRRNGDLESAVDHLHARVRKDLPGNRSLDHRFQGVFILPAMATHTHTHTHTGR